MTGYGARRHLAIGTAPAAPGHRRYSGTPSARSTADPGLIERVRAERARRALYAGCDRAPLDWERRS